LFVSFHLYTAFTGAFDAHLQRAIHLTFGLVILFLNTPYKVRAKKWFNILCAFLSLLPFAYMILNYPAIQGRFILVDPVSRLESLLGVLIIILVIEATRRVVGMTLVYLSLAFILYGFLGSLLSGFFYHPGISFRDMIEIQYLSTEGIYGIPLGVSATYIVIFIIFGEFIRQTGIGNFMYDISAHLAGRTRGGPAKIAVVSSAIFGSISGSGTANVVTTGSITIPIMKKIGYRPHIAGAIEAVASTGGQIMPPLMAATAFVISAFTGIPYITICKYALFPAILYFSAIFIIVHLEAERFDLKGVEPERSLWVSIKAYAHMVFPIILLIYLLIKGYTPMLAGAYCVLTVVIFSLLRHETRMTPRKILDTFQKSSNSMMIVIMACATAGIIFGITNFTGLGIKFSAAIVRISGGNLFIAMVLTMFASLILGMGMPTTPAYVIQAALTIPALIKMGLPVHSAHLFVFYYSCMSLITPPVAVTAYAAAGIANSDPWRTGWAAFRLGSVAYVVPFMFVFGPSLLLIGSFWEIVTTIITALLGVFSLAVSIVGYWKLPLSFIWRGLALVSAILLIFPGFKTDIVGFALVLIILFRSRLMPGNGLNRVVKHDG